MEHMENYYQEIQVKQSIYNNGQYGIQTEINGLLYMRTRYYNPEIKRFINQDTVLGSITNS